MHPNAESALEVNKFVETFHKRVRMSTNRWGMRDREYAKAKPAGTYRVAMLGSSYEMGPGVPDGATYEAVLEDLLNDEISATGPRTRYSLESDVPSASAQRPPGRGYFLRPTREHRSAAPGSKRLVAGARI